MELTTEEKESIIDAILAVDEQRLWLNEAISECVSKGITLRSNYTKLSHVREKLADILRRDKKADPPELEPKKK